MSWVFGILCFRVSRTFFVNGVDSSMVCVFYVSLIFIGRYTFKGKRITGFKTVFVEYEIWRGFVRYRAYVCRFYVYEVGFGVVLELGGRGSYVERRLVRAFFLIFVFFEISGVVREEFLERNRVCFIRL